MRSEIPNGLAQEGLIQLHRFDDDAVKRELEAGLMQAQPTVAPKYLYDALGSRLFATICELDEYYPTRTEAGIFRKHESEIAEAAGRGVTLIDLGAGDCSKAEALFPSLKPAQYAALDISVDYLRGAISALHQRHPELDVCGVGIDFSSTLELPARVRAGKRLFFYPGSSIGNFSPPEALAFLQRVREACKSSSDPDGGLLIGVDLIKEKPVLEAAYDDALGLTAAFNLNVLRNLNRILGADFDVRQWKHLAFYNEAERRIEMHLEAVDNTMVRWQEDGQMRGQRRFERGETIHTENSYKYERGDFLALLERAGFNRLKTWTDARGWFLLCHARAA